MKTRITHKLSLGILIAALAAAPVSSASAYDHWHGGGVALGVAAGAAVLGAAVLLSTPTVVAAPAPVYYTPAPYAYYPPAYYAPAPVYYSPAPVYYRPY